MVLVAVGVVVRLAVAVEASQAGFDVEQGAGNIHHGAVVDGLHLVAQLVDQFDLFGDDLAGNTQPQHRQGVSHLAKPGEQIFQLSVLALFGANKQVELVLELGQLFIEGANHGVDCFAARAGNPAAGSVYVVLGRQGLVQLVLRPQILDLGGFQIPGPGDVIKKVLQQRLRRWLLQDVGVFIGESTNFAVQFPQQGFNRSVDRVYVCLQGLNKGAGCFPEFAPGRFLAQPNKALDDLLHVIEMGCQIVFADYGGQGKLVHLAQFADMTQDLRVLQALGYLASDSHVRATQVGFEQGCI